MATNFETVMLVDDNKIDAILNKKVLEKDGFSTNIQVYNSALLALKQLESIAENSSIAKPSLIFVDMMMPEMNGFQFIDKFEQLPDSIKETTKIVFMSGSMLSQDQLEKLEHNKYILKFISKPISKNALNSIIELNT